MCVLLTLGLGGIVPSFGSALQQTTGEHPSRVSTCVCVCVCACVRVFFFRFVIVVALCLRVLVRA